MRLRSRYVSLALALAAAGCAEERVTKPGAGKVAAAPKPAEEQVKSRETIGKRTQTVLKLSDAIQQGGVPAATNIPVADPLTQNAAAYRTTVGKIGAMSVEQAIQIRNAQSIADPKPLTYDEFVNEIIKPNQPDGIQLAMLPYYQEYAWDEQNQKLIVVEFPEKKQKFQEQQDKELGRR
jgi:hypothetical protein